MDECGFKGGVASIEAASSLHEGEQQIQGRLTHNAVQVTSRTAQSQLNHQHSQQTQALGINGALHQLPLLFPALHCTHLTCENQMS